MDHFNVLTSNATFRQRYLLEDSNFTAGGPIFAFCGGEGGDVPEYYGSYSTPIALARSLGGKIVFMEARFFGESLPFNGTRASLTPEPGRIGLLSIEQMLADYTALLAAVLDSCGDACATSRVVTFGGSLAGSLAALLRLRAPWLVDAAWASSAPLLGYESARIACSRCG